MWLHLCFVFKKVQRTATINYAGFQSSCVANGKYVPFSFLHQQSLQDLTNFVMKSLIRKAQKKETVERMETDGFSVANSKFSLVICILSRLLLS